MNAPDSVFLQKLMDQAGVLVVEMDPGGQISWISRGLEALAGYTAEEMKGLDEESRSLPRPEDFGLSRVLPLTCRDGFVRHVEWSPAGVCSPQVEAWWIGKDITELQHTREALAASEKRSSAVLETAVNAIITMSEERVIETANSATERIFGYSRDEMVGQNIRMLMPQPYRDKHDGYVENYLKTGVKKIIGIGREAVGQRRDGTVFPMDLSVGEALLPDGRRVFTGIIRDLTDRKQLEEKILQISEEEQHRIGQDIHDDLCQQLAAIGCLAKVAHQQLQRDGNAGAENLQEIVHLVTRANVRAREMSRGLMPVVLDAAGLMAALEDLAGGTRRIYDIGCYFLCRRPVDVADNKVAIQLFRIAQEAVANAVKHSHAASIEIRLAEVGGCFQLCIQDNGIGIPDNVSGKSTGMGLLTMTHRARMLGGMLTVEHPESGGTAVHCSVPISSLHKNSFPSGTSVK